MSENKVDSNSVITKKDKYYLAFFTLILGILNIAFFFFIALNFTVLDYLLILGLGVLAVAPAYFANAAMPLVGGGRPLDGGHNFFDGERIFGDGKTIKGFVGGFVIGTLAGYGLALINPIIADFAIKQRFIPPFPWFHNLRLVTPDEAFAVLGYNLFNFDISFIFRIPLLALGGPVGDLIGSFFKRRAKVKRGGKFPILDQLDFILCAIAFAYPLLSLHLHYIIIVCLLTPLIALLGNWVAYKAHKKAVPW